VLAHFKDKKSLEIPFYMRMDFSNPITKERLSQTIEEEKERPGNIYKHHWMDGNMEFNDGVKISWEIEDVIRKNDGDIQDKLSGNELVGKYHIQHTLNMHFSAPKEQFIADNKDMMETNDGKYYIVSIHKKDISESLDQGMSPEVFISSLEEGYHFVKLKKPIDSE
jgi:hypothetical protein